MRQNEYVILHDSMLDEDDMVCFSADIPYLVEESSIYNGDQMIVELTDIWVDYHLENGEECGLQIYQE